MLEDFKKDIGIKIKNIRENLNISREELAFRAGVSGSYIGMIERAEYDFKISKLYNIAKGLNVSPSDLLKFD